MVQQSVKKDMQSVLCMKGVGFHLQNDTKQQNTTMYKSGGFQIWISPLKEKQNKRNLNAETKYQFLTRGRATIFLPSCMRTRLLIFLK